jgi:beta-glucosidase
MSRMSPEQKVGQIIQADIGHLTPEELRRYQLGAVFAGGDSAPAGGSDRSPATWLGLTPALRAASPIPILFGIDAVHGNNAVQGATIFPHNIGLGAAHDAALMGRIGVATAQEMAVVGFDWAFAPDAVGAAGSALGPQL